MADTTKKASRVLQDMFGISQNDYDMMEFNARRYERTDAGVEDAVLRQIFSLPEVQEVMEGKTGSALRQDSVFSMRPVEFDKTKVFNAANVLRSIGAEVPKKDDKESAEQKLVRLYDENPNFVRNRVLMDKDFGQWGANNLDQLVESAREYKYTKPELSWPNKIAGSVFYPRSLESMREGRDVQTEDIVGDIAESVLMALPIGWASGGLKAGRAAKVLAGLGGAFAVPLATEGLDAAMYSPDENLDRSVFQPSDVAFGGATNIAAPFMGSRALGRLGRWIYGGNPLAKQADNVVMKADNAAGDILDKQIRSGGFVVPDQRTADRVEKMISGDVENMLVNDPAYWQAMQGAGELERGIVNEATLKAADKAKNIEARADEVIGRSKVIAGYMLAGDSYQEAVRKAEALGTMGNRMSAELYRRSLPEPKPSLGGAVLGSWVTNKYGNNRNANATLELASGLLQTVEPGLSLEQKLEDWRDARAQAAADAYRAGESRKVLDVLGGGEDADTYWLKRLSDEPWIARGEGDGATSSFKNWWNTRGMKLFGDTALFGGIKE